MHHKHKDKSQHFSMRSFLHKMETRRLRNSDMKKLVRIFRRVPAPTEKRYEHKETLYHEHTKAAIQRLPSRLRSSRLSFGLTNLCSHHHGLNQNLVDDIWSWIHHEFDKAIGRFLFPLIMSHGLLTADQKSQIRQLEPVLQMWQPDFNVEASAPPGHEPIQCESKWHYQQDQCKACMLARIGTHEHVLFVLFAGMVGRFNTKTFTTMDALRSVAGRDSIKSKRLRFVRYWVRKTLGDTALLRAADLGLELKHLRLQWKYEQQRQPQLLSHIRMQKTPNRTLEQRPPTAAETFHRRPFGNSAISTADSQQYHQAAVPKLFDPKLGPNPRPPDVERLSPAEDMGFELELSSMRERTYTVPKDQKDIHPALRRYPASALLRSPTNASKRSNETRGSSDSEHTFRPGDSMSDDSPHPGLLHPAYLRADSVLNIAPSNPSCASTKLYAPSVATTRTIASYNGGPSSRANHVDPLDNPIYNHIETQEERVEKYRRLLATRSDSDPFAEYEDEAIALPKPQRQSMYSAWGDVAFDGSRFDKIDEEIAEDEIGNWEKDKSDDDDDDDDEIFCEENMGEHVRYIRNDDASVRPDYTY